MFEGMNESSSDSLLVTPLECSTKTILLALNLTDKSVATDKA